MKIGYLGPVGTYCYEVANTYTNEEIVAFKNIEQTISSVVSGETDKCIVPIENSIEGSVNQTIDTLLNNEELIIEAEIVIDINHYLLAKNDIKLSDVRTIYSHSQAIAQCRRFIKNNVHNANIEELSSTAAAAKKVQSSDKAVAIANKMCADIYNLRILKECIQDEQNNQTKFIVISKIESTKRENTKTSVLFSVLNKPGELYKVLGLFNIFEINLTKIESRPAKTNMGEYIFWIDFDGNKNDDNIKILLSAIQKKCSYFRVLGSY